MAIRIVDGNPGGGKTYWAVNHLLKDYYVWEEEIERYCQKDENIKIVTNIDDFKLPHISLGDLIRAAVAKVQPDEKFLEKYGPASVFFSHGYQEALSKEWGCPIVYVIDEAQRYFHKRFYLREVFEWAELHRHFGQDVYLITQNKNKIAPDILTLCEIVVHAIARTRSLTGKELRYHHMSDGDVIRTEVLILSEKIFGLYKSMSAKEVEKIKNPIIRKMLLAVVVCILFMLGGLWYLKHSMAPKPPAGAQAAPLPTGSPSSSTQNQQHPGGGALVSVSVPYFKYQGMTSLFLGAREYDISTFPYPLSRSGNALYALIPQQDYDFLFSSSSQVNNSAREQITERREPMKQ